MLITFIANIKDKGKKGNIIVKSNRLAVLIILVKNACLASMLIKMLIIIIPLIVALSGLVAFY